MTNWSKETALIELEDLIKEVDQLAKQHQFSANHTRWIVRTLTLLEEVFGGESLYYLNFTAYNWSRTDSCMINAEDIVAAAGDIEAVIKRKNHIAYLEQLASAKGLLWAAMDHLKRTDNLDAVYKGKDTAPESSLILKIINITERKLRKTIRNIPSREKEVQDAFEDLLIGADIPYSKEKEAIEYSSKTYRPDFVIPKIDLAIEIKLCAKKDKEKRIIAEINDDILAYQTKFGNLFFVVYDTGYIRDIDIFIEAFERNENVTVKVVKN